MNENLIKRMSRYMKQYEKENKGINPQYEHKMHMYDFDLDKKTLSEWDGKFIWHIHDAGTYLFPFYMEVDNPEFSFEHWHKDYKRKNLLSQCEISKIWCGCENWWIFYDGKRLHRVTREMAIALNDKYLRAFIRKYKSQQACEVA